MKRKRIVQTPSAQSDQGLVPAIPRDYPGLLSDIGSLLVKAIWDTLEGLGYGC